MEKSLHILVIAGDSDIRERIVGFLEGGTGYSISRVREGNAGLEAVRNGEVDCVVLGGELPDMDGYEFLAAAHSDASLPACPVVVVTDEENASACIRAGAEDTIGWEWMSAASLRRAITNTIARHAVGGDSLRAQSRLAADGRFLKRVLDNLFAFVGVMLPDGTLIEVNEAPLAIAGLRAEDVLGKKFWDCYWWSHLSGVQADLKRAWKMALRGELARYDVPVRVAGGELLWIDFQLAPLFDEEGNITHLIPSGMDLSERIEAQNALRESENRFRATFERIGIGVAHVGLDGRWIWINKTVAQITGYPADELRGLTFADITHPDDLGKDLVLLRRLRAGEIPDYSLEKRYIRKGGGHVWVNITVSMMCSESGSPLFYIASIEDIAVRKAAEEELEKQRRFIERLTAVMPSVLYVFDLREKRNVWGNRQVGEALGYTGEEITGMGEGFMSSVMHPEDFVKMPEYFGRVAGLEDGKVTSLEYRFRHKDGTWRWFQSFDTPFLRDAAESVAEIIGTATEISARKLAEETLQESEERFRAVFEHAATGIAIADWEGRLERGNPAFLSLLGYTGAELTAMRFTEVIHP